ncbi:MAG: trigger factor [Nitrospirae bacterium]|nr:trigger factor [Magnetococcales bacterium]
MEVTIEEKATFDREITLVLSAAEVDQQMDQELAKLATTVRLPGFRPGKVPRKVLEARFKEHIAGTIGDRVFRESYHKALTDHDLNPVDRPEVVVGDLERGKDFTLRATIQIFPKVEPVGYTGLQLTQAKVEITEDDIDKVIEEVREGNARFEASTERSAEKGDQVVMDFEGFVDGTAFAGGKAEKYVLELGSNHFIPGFEDQLLSAKGGDNREVKVTFPADYGNVDLAGKEALFQCVIREVRQRILPELDDALAKLVGITEGGVEAMRTMIRDRLEKDVAIKIEKRVEKTVYDALLHANPFEIPSRLERLQQQNMLAQMKRDYQSKGIDVAKMGIADDHLLKMLGESAGNQVRIDLLLASIADKENIQVDAARVDEKLDEMTMGFGERSAEVKRMVQQNEEKMESLKSAVLQASVVEWIVKNSTVTQQPLSLDELIKSNDATGK